MDAAKIQLSQEERELVVRADWILTKNKIITKTIQLLEEVQLRQKIHLDNRTGHLPAEVLSIAAKVSKGENYKGLPYLILDQPRYFGKGDVFAIRHLFWWGRFFSGTMHLAGQYKIQYQQNIVLALPALKRGGYYFCVNEDPWQHDFDEGNYIPLINISAGQFEQMVREKPFIKLSRQFPVDNWDNASEKLMEIFLDYLSILEAND
jgi:hypothetical protein